MSQLFTKRFGDEKPKANPEKAERIMQKLQQNIEEKKQNKKKKMKKEDTVTPQPAEADIPQVDVEMESVEIVTIPAPTEKPSAAVVNVPVPDEYTILGTDKHEKRKSVKTILPAWLAYPTIVSNNLTETGQAISELDFIDEQIKKNLAKMKVEHLFPVQKEVIPWLLDVHSKPSPYWPRDVCVSAPTGSGKTLSFAVPIVQLLLKRVERKIKALIILPVQELADQVAQVVKQLTVNTKLKAHLLSSSFSFAAEQAQIIDVVNGKYLSNVDILITTAGRLVEHLNKTKGFSLKSLQFLVIDEADRVMDQIQNDWLYHLNKHVKSESDTFLVGRPVGLCPHDLWNTPRPPHKLLFSATLSSDPEKLQSFNLFHPKLFTTVVVQPNALFNHSLLTMEEDGEKRGSFVGKYTTPAELTEKYIITEQHVKPLSLFTIIKENKWRKFLCFTNQADTAHRLAFVLQKLMGEEMKIEELSSALTISARKSVLQKFSLGEINGLISTDALARGIDIPKVDVVISYDLCKDIKSYIHRVGRTARAGNQGTAVTLLTENNVKTFKRMLEDVGKTDCHAIETTTDENYSLVFAEAIKSLQKALEYEKKNKQNMRNNKQGTSNLLARLQQQVDKKLNNFDHPLPKAWRAENLNADGEATKPEAAVRSKTKKKAKKRKLTE